MRSTWGDCQGQRNELQGSRVVPKKGHPGLRRPPGFQPNTFQIPGHGAFMDFEAEQRQFAVYPGRSETSISRTGGILPCAT